MPSYHLPTTGRTAHWGYFDANLAPAIAVASGSTITIETINGGPDRLPATGFDILPEYADVHVNSPQKLPGHILTGPVFVDGAKPGGVLQVDILDVVLRQDWAYNVLRPLWGALPNDFERPQLTHIALDRERNVGRMPWGVDVPLAPFFGVMGVAPPPEWGVVSTIEPRRNGGNLDNKELRSGATLYLPVFADGGLFSVGDGHGAQGDGEVCVSAIETALTGTFRLTARNDMALRWPRAETSTHLITMAFDPDLDVAARTALRTMMDVIVEAKGLSREDAYMLCSIAADLRVTQMVNRNNGIHVMLEKRYLT